MKIFFALFNVQLCLLDVEIISHYFNLLQHKCFTTIHKHYSVEEWKEFGEKNKDVLDFVAVSSGISSADWERLQQILALFCEVREIKLTVR